MGKIEQVDGFDGKLERIARYAMRAVLSDRPA